VLTGVRAEKVPEVAVVRVRRRRDERLDAEKQSQRNHDQPQPAAATATLGFAWGTEPERLPHGRPAEGALLAPHEDDHEHELPDQAGGEQNDQRFEPAHSFHPTEVVLEVGSGKPGQRRHRKSRRRPDRKNR
jgi:hypothetical protein